MGIKAMVVFVGDKDNIINPRTDKIVPYKVPFEVGDTVHISYPPVNIVFIMMLHGLKAEDWCIVDEFPCDIDGCVVTYHRSWFAPISDVDEDETNVEKIKEFISQPDKLRKPYQENPKRQVIEIETW